MTDAHPVDVALENRLMGRGIYVTDCEYRPPDGDVGDADSSEGDVDDTDPSAGHTDDTDLSDDSLVTPPDGTGLVLEYETVSETAGVESGEVGTVVRTVLDVAAEREWSPGRLEATSLTTDGDVRGHWHVERDWFDRLGIGLDDLEFSQRVLETRRSDAAEK
ncbi:hypothetical protein [Haloterrigena alkaliphila]|uniref:DUF8159 domain-containing protein n=1 Tax=Haloterrigena alkaliphila TaxID=2816475 RepID=A0A8A2VEY0_9EURY|nr:hypothetical protein [Haloterrigena alkaliphila]QSW98912.1 hypothetical protein J0X25_16235 [Haloterrigena alkaliphila]